MGDVHTTPLWIDRDSDLRRAVRAVDPDDQTLVLPVVSASATRVLIPAIAGAVVGLGALSLLVGAVVSSSNSATTMIAPPLGPVSDAGSPAPPAALPASVRIDTPPPTAIESFEKMAPRVPGAPAEDPKPVRQRLHEMFPRLFP